MANNSSKKIVSASLASWINIIINVLIQILLVPIYLKYWGSQVYGLWLLFLAVWAITIIPQTSYLIYTGFEILKKAKDKSYVNDIMTSVLIISIILSFFPLVISAILMYVLPNGFLSLDHSQTILLGKLVLIYSIGYILSISVHSVIEKWLIPYGFNPYFAWFRVYKLLVTYTVAILLVVNNFDIISTVIGMITADILLHFCSFIFLRKKLSENDLKLSNNYSLYNGLIFLKKSTWLMFKYLLDSIRNVGVRVLLAANITTDQIALFSTLRTPANIILQGVNSIAFSIQPELMLSIRDQEYNKVYIYNTILWLFLSLIIIPLIIIIQIFMPNIFKLWTLGMMEFDSNIFAIFSIIALLYGIYSPMESIIKGNNLVKILAFSSFISSFILILLIIVTTKEFGILGAALSLLTSEFFIFTIYLFYSYKWMRTNNFKTPYKHFFLMMSNFFIASIFLILISYNNNIFLTIFPCLFSIGTGLLMYYYYPYEVKMKIKNLYKGKMKNEN